MANQWIFAIIVVMKAKTFLNRTISAPKPDTQNTTLCAGQSQADPVLAKILATAEQVRPQSPGLHALLLVMLAGGLRVSEVLKIQHTDILQTGHVRIRASKRSADRFIHSGEAAKFLARCKSLGRNPFSEFDRFYLYRFFKSRAISLYNGPERNSSVTHSIRHITAKAAQSNAGDLEMTAALLGHKSTESTKHYVNKKKSARNN